MKHLIRLLTLSLFFTSCGGPQPEGEGIPEDLAGKKALLKEKRAELRKISSEVAELEAAIEEQDPSMKEGNKQLVTITTIGRKDFKHFIEIQGAVEADDLVDVTSEVPGRILTLKVNEGESVSKGQLIATLDLEAINKQIAELETSLDLANTVYERQERLWKQNIGSEMQYLESKNSKERLEKSLETLKFQLSKAEVYAPISGVVEREVLQSGEMAASGMPIVQILNTSKLKVVANVPENYLRSVKRGEGVTLRFPALEMERKATVSMIGRTIDPANRTFKVEVNIGSQGGVLKPNLLATMLINDFEEKNVVTVPREIIQQEVSGRDFVFVTSQGPEGKVAKKIYVTTGKSFEGEVVINEGLNGDEELIMEGALGLADNMLIEVQNAKKEANNG